jgi:hypothetical protein
MPHRDADEHLSVWEADLAPDEARRRAAVVEALDDGWDPVAVLAGEDEALRLLYSGLDGEQERTLRLLQDSGVLPPAGRDGRAAD